MSDYIPLELISNILARLPVDDVLRCTSVCKSWYSLIISPSFASSHRNLSSPNQEPRLLIRYYKSGKGQASYCLRRDNKTFDEIEELDTPLNGQNIIIDILNGLVCLRDYGENAIGLWNPSLRKYLILPKPRILPRSGPVGFNSCTIGFGIVATTNEYKIVRYHNSTKTGLRAEVYQLSTGSWRDVKVRDGFNFSQPRHPRQAYLKGVLHWNNVRYLKEDNPAFLNYIVSFDLENEEFGTMMIPSCLRHENNLHSELRPLRESLHLINRTRYEFCDIWMMKEYGVPDSWEKLFIINEKHHNLTTFLNFRHNGELLWEKVSKTSRRLVSYDCNNKRVENLGFRVKSPVYVYFVSSYVDNLLLVTAPNDAKIKRLMKNPPRSED